MNDVVLRLTTTEAREHNPKAVFLGEAEGIITPLALYLSQRNVELFAGKTLSDAFFGDYFFYIGTFSEAKKILATNIGSLPKALFLVTGFSDLIEVAQILNKFEQVKFVALGHLTGLNKEQVERIMNFFLGSTEKQLILAAPDYNVISKTVSSADNILEATKKMISDQSTDNPDTFSPVSDKSKTENYLTSETSAATANFEVTDEDSSLVEEMTTSAASIGKNEPQKSIPAEFSKPNELDSRLNNLFNDTNSTNKESKKKISVTRAILTAFIVTIFFPITSLFVNLFVGNYCFFKQYKTLILSKTSKSLGYEKCAAFFLHISDKSFSITEGLFSSAGQRSFYNIASRTINNELIASDGLGHLAQVAKNSSALITGLTGVERGVSFAPLISAIRGDLDLAGRQFGLLEAESKTDLYKSFFEKAPDALKKYAAELNRQIKNTGNQIYFAQNSLQILPETIGLYKKKTYMLVFQNNMELRPTGGFIGSYGLVTFEDGALSDFKVEDVYAADGSLKGHVDPPEPIRVHLGQEHWYMRDSNWDPDFTQSASRIAWFLEKEMDTKVDGVIAVDLYLAQKLLEITGPITLADFSETVTTDTVFFSAQTHVQTDFFPGSTQKKDFLGALARSLQEALVQEKVSKIALFQKLQEAILEKHLLVYFSNPLLQQVAHQNDWSGEIILPSCGTCVVDFTAVVDANVGVNKANLYVERRLKDTVTINENGQVGHLFEVTYKNNSPSLDTHLGGTYKNYVRILLPEQTDIISAAENDLPLTLDEGTVASQSSVVVQVIRGQKVLSYLLEVTPEEKKVISFSYNIDFADLKNTSQYRYVVSKQPGTLADPIQLTVIYPPAWQVKTFNEEAPMVAGATTLVNGSQITYNTTLLEDRIFKLQFAP